MNIVNKEDRRVRKTKRALREGLAGLLVDKSIQNITVKELTDKVDIHRSTFYATFADIYDLYNQIEEAVIQEISNIFSENSTVDSKTFYEILFRYISDNRNVCRMFLGKNVSPTFSGRLNDLFKEACLTCWQNEDDFTGSIEELEYFALFYLSGSLAVIGKWVDGEFECSSEQLIKMFTDINDNFGEFIYKRLD